MYRIVIYRQNFIETQIQEKDNLIFQMAWLTEFVVPVVTDSYKGRFIFTTRFWQGRVKFSDSITFEETFIKFPMRHRIWKTFPHANL